MTHTDAREFNLGDYVTPTRIFWVAVILGALICASAAWGYMNSIWNEGVARENALNAQYEANQNYLSSYISGFYETVGVANAKRDALDKILTDAVKGRYEGHTSAQPGQGSLFSAIVEAYPSLDLTVYDKIVDYIKGGRAGYRDTQDKLLDMLKEYDQWRQSGIAQHFIVAFWGFPSHDLKACVGTDCRHGGDAEDRMWQIVLAPQAKAAYGTGTMAPLSVPKN